MNTKWRNKIDGSVLTVAEVYEERIGGLRIKCVGFTNGLFASARWLVANYSLVA